MPPSLSVCMCAGGTSLSAEESRPFEAPRYAAVFGRRAKTRSNAQACEALGGAAAAEGHQLGSDQTTGWKPRAANSDATSLTAGGVQITNKSTLTVQAMKVNTDKASAPTSTTNTSTCWTPFALNAARQSRQPSAGLMRQRSNTSLISKTCWGDSQRRRVVNKHSTHTRHTLDTLNSLHKSDKPLTAIERRPAALASPRQAVVARPRVDSESARCSTRWRVCCSATRCSARCTTRCSVRSGGRATTGSDSWSSAERRRRRGVVRGNRIR
eukprot:Selendium_serpulae@DN6231_c2_g1_i4.p1